MKRSLFLILIAMMGSINIMAQYIVSGTVVDKKNVPMPGVNVSVVDRSETTTTDIDGRFKMDLPVEAKKIKLTYPGYDDVEVKIKPDMLIKMGSFWAVHTRFYRGFVNIGGGPAFGSTANVSMFGETVEDIHPGFALSFTTTHGMQVLSNLFVGLGIGYSFQAIHGVENYYDGPEGYYSLSSIYVPIFAEARWDMNLQKTASPFASLKLGYQLCYNVEDECFYSSAGHGQLGVFPKGTGSAYIEPTIGYRFKTRDKAGLSLGLSYTFAYPYRLNIKKGEYEDDPDYGYFENKKFNGSSLMFHVIFDF